MTSIAQFSTELTEQSFEEALLGRILDRSATVGVVGLGYVGLPLAVEKARVGYSVIGYDRSGIRVAQINQGSNYIRDVDDDHLAKMVATKKLRAETDFASLATCDVVVICVPTPLTVNKDPDTSYIKAVGSELAQRLRPGQLVCLESTSYPGTTEELLLPQFAATGLVVGKDYFLAYSPERVDPGNQRYTTRNTNKIVGGVTLACSRIATAFYQQTIAEVLQVSSPRAAEMTKVFENTFRAVNIALVNEMALLCDKMKIDIWEVIDAAATKPFGMMRFEPGPGVGGHCIPLDPFYLAWKARQYDFRTRFIELAGEINDFMPYFVREKLARALNARGCPLKGSKILLVGMAYKRDVPDWRESPALKICQLLMQDGAIVDYHDPLVPSFQDDLGFARYSVPLSTRVLADSDCVLVMTDHSQTDWDAVVRNARLVLDTRHATKGVSGERENVILL
ncbi:MAG TPA: nucleotide sugar dehydrogenase [Candidatus Acidoferrales bacterium]|nr:nucleotide sugar dehydrogenase [Candidatus Acidoferrales bacterium]